MLRMCCCRLLTYNVHLYGSYTSLDCQTVLRVGSSRSMKVHHEITEESAAYSAANSSPSNK
eukprot:9361158-Pyramimonas_sp.AAC.3